MTESEFIARQAKQPGDQVLIPTPYKGLSLRLGTDVINVHDVKQEVVYYGIYRDGADHLPFNCLHLYQMPEQDFIEGFGRALIDGAIAFSRIVADTIMTPSAIRPRSVELSAMQTRRRHGDNRQRVLSAKLAGSA